MPPFTPERVDDTAAKLCYHCPAGWHTGTDDLVAPFTLAIRDAAGGLVVSGRWDHLLAEPPSAAELIAGAAWLASEYGEFFVPGEGDRTEIVMENTTVCGRPAARAGYLLAFHPDDREAAYVRVLVVSLPSKAVSFVLGVGPDTRRHIIDGILASVQPVAKSSADRLGG